MIKIAIFENEYVEVETAFKALNFFYYGNSLEFTVFRSSQELVDFEAIKGYQVVFVDLDLSLSSKMDGYTLIKKFLEVSSDTKMIIISASSKESIATKLIQKGLPEIPMIIKPVDYTDIYGELRKVLPPVGEGGHPA